MNADAVEAAARNLCDLRLRESVSGPIRDLPEAVRPRTLADAYAIQARLSQLLGVRAPGPAVGWKIGCTTVVMQQYLGIDHPCAGRLYANRVHASSVRLKASDFFSLGLECEIAVRLGSDIGPRRGGHTAASVRGAVESVCASIEIVEHRFEDFAAAAAASLVADDFFSAGCVLSEPVPAAAVDDFAALRGGFHLNGATPEVDGTGESILGHPLNALAWLADHALARGTALAAGEVVTLGSVVKTIYPDAGTRVEARFDELEPALVEVV